MTPLAAQVKQSKAGACFSGNDDRVWDRMRHRPRARRPRPEKPSVWPAQGGQPSAPGTSGCVGERLAVEATAHAGSRAVA
eukprot:12610872-Heterocapsa_arctica.AAC.1